MALLQHAAFLLVFVGTLAFFSWLDVANVRYGEHRLRERADWVSERFDADPDEIADYDRAKTGVSLLETWTTLLLVLVVLYSGLFADAVSALQSTGLPMVAQGAVFFAGAAVLLSLATTPFSAYSTFVVEDLFDFNEQTPRLFVRDLLVSLAVSIVLVGGLSAALLWIIDTLPGLWAVGGLALFVVFSLAMQVVYPRVIAPLFNDFTPIEEGDLREAVEAVFSRAGFECDQLYEMDASRRSSKTNAYFIGFGRTKRVVLFDTLVDEMSLDEVQAVLAHELAHWRENHVWKLMAASFVQIGVLLAAAQYLTATGWLYAMFGVPADATYAGLALALLWLFPLLQWLSPVTNQFSLAFEREADDFGAKIAGTRSMVTALQTLGGENLANPFPHPLYETFHYDHPPIPERIRRLEEEETASEGEDGAAPA